jgi:hypothetical protein
MLVGPSVQTLTESAALIIADSVKVVLAELAKSTRTSNVERRRKIERYRSPIDSLSHIGGHRATVHTHRSQRQGRRAGARAGNCHAVGVGHESQVD